MYLIGVAVFIFGFLFSLIIKGVSLGALWVPPAILISVIVPILSVLTGTGGWRTFGRAFKASVLPKANIPEDELGRAATLFRLLSKVTAMCGGIGVLIGLIVTLHYLDDIEILGHAISSALVAPMLTLALIAGVYEPMVFIMKKRQSSARVRVKRD